MIKSRHSKKKLANEIREDSTNWQDYFSSMSDKVIPIISKFFMNAPISTDEISILMSTLSAFFADDLPKLNIVFQKMGLAADKLFPVNSSNSSLSPASDPNRKKRPKSKKTGRKQGGQDGHTGSTLKQVDNPDKKIEIPINREKLPPGNWKPDGHEKRQVFGILTRREVIEYLAERLVNERGEKITADFPDGVNAPVQYSDTIKTFAVYLNTSHMIPFDRLSQLLNNLFEYDISTGTLYNFRRDIASNLTDYKEWARETLINSEVLFLDETGININSKRVWLHVAASENAVLAMANQKRGSEAMNDMDILPHTTAVLTHDHWSPYYKFTQCLHSLCNAHLIRELNCLHEDYNQKWAKKMKDFLLSVKSQVELSGGVLSKEAQIKVKNEFMVILQQGDVECPEDPRPPGKKRGRPKKTKSKNLLERLKKDVDDVLRFATNLKAQFTNNTAENHIRMYKVHQKISGCFRSWQGAEDFILIRSYILTCGLHEIGPYNALNIIVNGELPNFINLSELDGIMSQKAA
jgi:transposase